MYWIVQNCGSKNIGKLVIPGFGEKNSTFILENETITPSITFHN